MTATAKTTTAPTKQASGAARTGRPTPRTRRYPTTYPTTYPRTYSTTYR